MVTQIWLPNKLSLTHFEVNQNCAFYVIIIKKKSTLECITGNPESPVKFSFSQV